jgi:hypothetical protein
MTDWGNSSPSILHFEFRDDAGVARAGEASWLKNRLRLQ